MKPLSPQSAASDTPADPTAAGAAAAAAEESQLSDENEASPAPQTQETAADAPAAAAAAEPEEAAAAAADEDAEKLFASDDEGSREDSLASDEDLFGDSLSAAAAAAAAADSDPEASAGATAAAAAASSAVSTEQPEALFRDSQASKNAEEPLAPLNLQLSPPWSPHFSAGSFVFSWKIPPAILLISEQQQQQQQEQQQQQGLAIKFSYDANAAAQGKPAYTSNCRLVQFSDDSYCLFIDDQGFECNIKEDVSYIFESSGPKEALCSVFSTDRRLQVLMRAGLRADSFFHKSKKADRLQQKMQTTPTTTELVEAAELAQKQTFLTHQEAARLRRTQQAEGQRGLTRGFLEAEESDQEDEQGESLEKIKERFKRRRFL